MTTMPTLIALLSSAVHQPIKRLFAAWATEPVRPAHLDQGFFTQGFRSIELVKLGHGEPLLKLNGVAAHDRSGIYVPL